MTPKHSLKAGVSSSATRSETTLRRVRVPLGQSWAAVYWELQAQNIEVAIGRGLKIFAFGGEQPERSASDSSERQRRFRAMFRQQKTRRPLSCVLGVLVIVPMLLLTATSLSAVELPEPPSQPVRTADSAPIVAKKPKCQLSKERAETEASRQDKWNKLGGVGYTHVTLRCGGKVADYQIVKNLISGSIVSTKQIG